MDSLAEVSAGKGSRAQKAVYSKLSESFQKLMKGPKRNEASGRNRRAYR